MSTKKAILLFSALLLLGLLFSAPAVLAQTPPARVITIEGELVNATTGEKAAAGLPLMLHTYDGGQMTNMIDGQTGPDGTFRFEDVEMVEGRIFEVMATVGQTTYFSEAVAPSPGEDTLRLPVTIYDTTDDASAIRIEQMHMLVDFFNPVLLQIAEIYIVSNTGQRTVEGAVTLPDGQQASLRFPLPAGATDLSFDGGQLGQRFIQTDDGFADTFGVPPGEGTSQFVVRYYIPYQDGMEIAHSLAYPTGQLSILLPQRGVTLSGEGLVSQGVRTMRDGRTVEIFAANFAPDQTKFAFRLDGQPAMEAGNAPGASPEATPPTRIANSNRMAIGVGIVLLGVALIAVGIWWWQRNVALAPQPVPVVPPSAFAPDSEEGALIQAIAELDESYQRGNISEREYSNRRGELRAELKSLLLRRIPASPAAPAATETAGEAEDAEESPAYHHGNM